MSTELYRYKLPGIILVKEVVDSLIQIHFLIVFSNLRCINQVKHWN